MIKIIRKILLKEKMGDKLLSAVIFLYFYTKVLAMGKGLLLLEGGMTMYFSFTCNPWNSRELGPNIRI